MLFIMRVVVCFLLRRSSKRQRTCVPSSASEQTCKRFCEDRLVGIRIISFTIILAQVFTSADLNLLSDLIGASGHPGGVSSGPASPKHMEQRGEPSANISHIRVTRARTLGDTSTRTHEDHSIAHLILS